MKLDEVLDHAALPDIDVDVDDGWERVQRRRRTRTRRRRALVASAVVLLGIAVVGTALLRDEDAPKVVAGQRDDGGAGAGRWERLPDAPLSGRTRAVSVWTGTEVVVFGGWTYLCAPGADCATPSRAPFRDGAAFDPTTRRWHAIASAPRGVVNRDAVAIEGNVYVLTDGALLRYRSTADTWDVLPAPGGSSDYFLTVAGRELIAYRDSDERGEVADYRFDTVASSWAALPNDPLPASYDRAYVYDGANLYLFAKSISALAAHAPAAVEVARLGTDGTWRRLPDKAGSGYLAWTIDGRIVVGPMHGLQDPRDGGVFDPRRRTWQHLPAAPEELQQHADTAGVLGVDRASYVSDAGWVLDLQRQRWVRLASRHDASAWDVAIASPGRDLFVFGGQRWAHDRGTLLSEAWLWTAP